MKEILRLLRKLDDKKAKFDFYSIRIFSDESGTILYDGEEEWEFYSIKDAKKKLKKLLK